MHQPDTAQTDKPAFPALPDWNAPELTVRAPAPDWFHAALAQPFTSQYVDVEGCPIHYLTWAGETPEADARGLMLVHGGGAHAQWWRFIAPFFTKDFRVAALDLSGMGDSGVRPGNTAEHRAREIRAVMAAARLGSKPFVVGHSFGGFMSMRYGMDFGDEAGGVVIADSPLNRPGPDGEHKRVSRQTAERFYPTFEAALDRFRLMPLQDCLNDYLVEFIGRHSLRKTPAGWTWKFDVPTMTANRFGEPFHQYLANMRCRGALIFGAKSALVNRDSAAYMSELMGPAAPVVEIPEAHHHLMLDQPLAFVAALRAVLDGWMRSDR